MQQEPNIPQFGTPPSGPNFDNNEPTVVSSERSRDGWRSVVSTILILIAAPIVALLLTNFVFQSYEVDGPSMETTLQNHDRLIVWKAPKTWASITNKYFIPNRGEIIIFNKRGLFDSSPDQEKQLIKRVIGLPGERVVVKDGIVTIYNAQHPEGFNPDANTEYIKSVVSTTGNVDITVPKGEVFVCGDNRGNSLDSRFFGTVPARDIVGTLAFRIFPLNKAKGF
jgi:signal peptidase I